MKKMNDNLKYEVEMMKEVIVDKDKLLDEKEATIKNVESEKTKLEKNVEELKESNNVTLKQKSNLEIELNTKDFIIQEIKKVRENQEKNDEVIEVSSGGSMDKTTSGSRCNFCDKSFRNDRDLDRHIQAKHEQPEHPDNYGCTLCGEDFTLEQEFNNHVIKCINKTITIVQCLSCKKNFAKGALKKHTQMGKCRPNSSNNKMQNHMRVNHTEDDKSRTVCHHWRRGQCLRGDSCMFAHVGFQNKVIDKTFTTRSADTPQTSRPDNSSKPCFNGARCIWLARNRCVYSHQEQMQPIQRSQQGVRQVQGGQQEGHQGVWQVQRGQQGNHLPLNERDCYFQERCKRQLCPYNHRSVTDFPNVQNQRNQNIWRNNQ